MAEYKEVRYERLFVKVPGTDKLRRRAAGRLRHLLATGWRETERVQHPDYIRVRVERTSPLPRRVRIKQAPAIAPRPRMGGRDGGRFGGPRGGGFRGGPGGPGGPGGGPRGPGAGPGGTGAPGGSGQGAPSPPEPGRA